MKNNIFKIICVISLLALSLIFAVSCDTETKNTHNHEFKAEWNSDKDGHWHDTTCGHDVKAYSAHEGMDDCICDVCGYVSHIIENTWTSDADSHWHKADCGNASHAANKADHVDMSDCECNVCGYKSHTFDLTKWEYDSEAHWNPASCGNAAHRTGYAKHAVQEKCGECICGFTTHTYGAPVKENETAATCTAEGSYDEVIYCTECGAEKAGSRNTVIVPVADHSYLADVWGKLDAGHYQACTKCGFKTDAVTHAPDGDGICAVCGFKAHTHTERTDPVKEDEQEATCKEKGSYKNVYYCTECDERIRVEAVETALGDHTPAEAVKENVVPNSCTEPGSYEAVVYCSVCGEELERKAVTIDADHKYSDEWTFDEDGHWHATTCGHDVVGSYSAHVGIDDCVCDECGYVTHSFVDEQWKYNLSHHWHMADCGNVEHIKDKTLHVGMDDCVCDECGFTSHQHDDSAEYEYDENGHWHIPTCNHKNEKPGYEEHTIDKTTGKCTECDYKDPTQGEIEMPIIPA